MDPKKPSDDRSLTVPQRQAAGVVHPQHRDAAAQIMREQIDKLYDSEPNIHASTEAALAESKQAESIYKQTHSESQDHAASDNQAAAWKHYHTQWQNYYRQYYERYYMSQAAKNQKKLEGHSTVQQEETPHTPLMVTAGEPEPVNSRVSAVSDLRNQLLERVKEQSSRVRNSKHFVPVAAALVVALTFVFLQYNSLIFATARAFVSPGSIDPANLIVDPTLDTKVGPEPKIIIPKINVDAPVVYDVPSIQESIVQQKLESGVVHYPIPGANAMPGEIGNSVILGHSSNDVFNNGSYKFVFVQLEKLEKGDTFYLHYNGTRYTYSVTEKRVIDPTQVRELVIDNGKPLATLVTCTPPGTALKRLIVIAEQISPDPATATTAQTTEGNVEEAVIPGNSPTLFQRLFGQ